MKHCNKGYKVMIELVKKELIYDIKNTAFSFADQILMIRFNALKSE